MKNQELRSSLIKSGIILTLCTFFIYAFASGDSGGISGTIGSLVSGLVFLLGLTLALIVSVLVLFGIYFGILYLYKPETCGPTYDEMKLKIGELSQSMGCGCCCSSVSDSSCTTAPPETVIDQNSTPNVLEGTVSKLQQELRILQDKLDATNSAASEAAAQRVTIESKLSSIEEDLGTRPTTESMDAIATQASADLGKLRESVSTMQGAIKGLQESLSDCTSSAKEDGDNGYQQKTDKAITELKEQLSTMQAAMSSLTESASTVATNKEKTSTKETEHRILSYFTEKSDANQFASKVTEAVKKGMTYAEIGGFLDDSLSAEASEVIADHPSLTKDYIRTCRQGS